MATGFLAVLPLLSAGLPGGASPVAGSVLIGAVPDAAVGGVNELLNPIDGQPILLDVYGNPRTSNGSRDIGAVQSVPEPSVCVLIVAAGAGWGVVGMRRRRSGNPVATGP